MEGNQMKMREALESARNWCLNRLGNASKTHWMAFVKMEDGQ